MLVAWFPNLSVSFRLGRFLSCSYSSIHRKETIWAQGQGADTADALAHPLGPQPDSHSPAPACGLSLDNRACSLFKYADRWITSTVPCSSDQSSTKTAGSWCIHTPALSPVGQENCEMKLCTVTHSPSKTEIQVFTVVSSLITPSTAFLFCLTSRVSWDCLPNKRLALESFSWGVLLGQPKWSGRDHLIHCVWTFLHISEDWFLTAVTSVFTSYPQL